MDLLQNVQGLELVVGAVLPPFVDFVNRFVKGSTWRYVISLIVSLAVGAALSYTQLSVESVLESGAIIFATAQTVYKTYYAGSGLRASLYGKGVAKR